jgi:hypothetical protein
MRLSLDRKPLLAVVVMAALVVVVVAMRDESPTGSTVAPSNRVSTGRTTTGNVDVDDVRLELLKERPAEIVEGERNPFRFQPRPAPAPPRVVESIRRPPIVSPQPQGPPPPPPIALRFIGLMEGAQAGRIAVLSDGRGNVFYGKEGDIIEGRYQLLKIGSETAELAYVDGRGRQTIRLSGQ